MAVALVQIASWLTTRWVIGTDPTGLESSLTALPTFAVLHGLARRRWRVGGGRLRANLDLTVGVPVLWFLGLNHHWLSSPGSERLVAASLYLLAALIFLRTTSGVGALRRLRRAWREHRQVPVLLGVLAFGFLVLLAPWKLDQREPDGDEPWYLLVTHSLAYDFDAVLDDNYQRQDSLDFMARAIGPQPGDPVDKAGRQRSRHGSALPLLLAPSYRVLGRTGAALTMAAITALFAWLILHWLVGMFGPRAVLLRLFLLISITSPLLLYSNQIWVEVPAGVLVTVGLICVERLQSRLDRRHGLGLLLAIVLLPLFKLRFGLLSIALIAVAVARLPLGRRRRLAMGGVGVVGLLGVLAFNAARFGNPLRNHGWSEILMPFTHADSTLQRLGGFLFDPAFGLIAFAPIWLIALPGLWQLGREDRPRLSLLLAVFAPYLIFAAARQEWYGGWSPPFRYALVSLPLAATALAAALLQRRRLGARLLWPPLAALSVALGALWTAVPGWTFNFANGSALWLDRLSQLTAVDWMLWTPSATRPTPATWLIPALLIAGTLGAWNLGPQRVGRRGVAIGACVLLALLVASTSMLARLPTTRVEAESSRVAKSGGQPEPPRWTFDRTRFPEGWTLPNGSELLVPVRPGGSQVEIEISRRLIRNRSEDLLVHVERHIGNGEYLPVGGLRLQETDWTVDRLGPVDWGDADQLRLRAGAPLFDREPGVLNGVSIDRIRFRWK